MDRLTFTDTSDESAVALINGRRFDDVLGGEEWRGVLDDELAVVARLLQGWRPLGLGLEREEHWAIRKPLWQNKRPLVGRYEGAPTEPIQVSFAQTRVV